MEWWIIGGAGAILLLLLAATYWAYWKAFYQSPKNRGKVNPFPGNEQYIPYREEIRRLMDELAATPCEKITISSSVDGTTLAARYYHFADGAPIQILFHGYRGAAGRDFCGGFRLCREGGCNALLVDQRAHGESGSRTITFGVKERYDCLDWANYAANRFPDAKIFLVGVSMGASTVLMASALPLPPQVVGVMADCGYTSPKEIIQQVIGDMGLPVKLAYPLVRLGGRLFGRFDVDSASVPEALRECRLPVLMVHGEEDRFVPCEMSRTNAAACGSEVTLITVPGAGHGMSYFADLPGYEKNVYDFVRRISEGSAPEK